MQNEKLIRHHLFRDAFRFYLAADWSTGSAATFLPLQSIRFIDQWEPAVKMC